MLALLSEKVEPYGVLIVFIISCPIIMLWVMQDINARHDNFEEVSQTNCCPDLIITFAFMSCIVTHNISLSHPIQRILYDRSQSTVESL